MLRSKFSVKEILQGFSIFLIAILIFLLSPYGAAYAWKPNTHVFLAEEALKDAIDDCRVSIYRTDYKRGRKLGKISDYPLENSLCETLRNNQAQYRAGVLGPDAYPDILTGQSLIHPDESIPDGTNSWLTYLWEERSNDDAIKAFITGFLTHAAGDMYGHTFVNHFTGGEFDIGINAVRHVILEGYVGKRTPEIRDIRNRVVNENSISITGVTNFIYQKMVDARPSSILNRQLIVGENSRLSVPKIYSNLRAELQRDVQDYYARKREYDQRIAERERAARNCRLLDFSCSAVALYAQANALRVERAAFIAGNGAVATYKEHWIDDVDSGLRAWPIFSHRLAKVLVFSSEGTDIEAAEEIAQQYVYDHLLSMAGAPDAVGGSLSFINEVIESIFPPEVQEAIETMKRDLLSYLLENTFDFTLEEAEAYFKDPERYFDQVMSRPFEDAQRTNLRDFNINVLHISDEGTSNLDEVFDYEKIPAAYNTVIMSKLLLLAPTQINNLAIDLGLRRSSASPNVMLGFIRTLDGDNEWVKNVPNVMLFAGDCQVYRQLFMRQLGEVFNSQGACGERPRSLMLGR